MSIRLFGVDFTSAPGPRKAITLARGRRHGEHFVLDGVAHIRNWDGFERLLREPGPWLGAFDFPFGLPREAVCALGWPQQWEALVRHAGGLSRAALRAAFDALRANRPAGAKYPHRAADRAAGSSPSVKLVNPPVGLMFHEGAPRLLAAGLTLPGMHAGDPQRIALEAYPGMTARAVVRAPYKNDARGKQTGAQREARAAILSALRAGAPHGMRLRCTSAWDRKLLDDASGDCLDAVICAVQAAWADARRAHNYGLPADFDPLEGWIVAAGHIGSEPCASDIARRAQGGLQSTMAAEAGPTAVSPVCKHRQNRGPARTASRTDAAPDGPNIPDACGP